MKIMHPHLAKLDLKGLKVIFIGYETRSKAYRLYDPTGGASERVARLRLQREYLLAVERCDRGGSKPRSIQATSHCHRHQQLHQARLRKHQQQLLLCPLNQWSSQHHVLWIRHWMSITMMVLKVGSERLKTYLEKVNHRNWRCASLKKRWPKCMPSSQMNQTLSPKQRRIYAGRRQCRKR